MLETVGYILLGLFLLLAPGFMLTLIFFPKVESLDFWKRMGLSLGFGVMALFYIGVVLSRPDWRMLRFEPFLVSVLILCGICAVVAYLRGGLAVPATYLRTVARAIHKPKPPAPPPAPPVQPAQEQAKPAQGQQAEGQK